MKYSVKVQGKAFDVEIVDGPDGTLARVVPDQSGKPRSLGIHPHAPEPTPAELVTRQGSLSALVTPKGRLTLSVDRTVEDGVYEVALPGGRPLRCEVEDDRSRIARANRAQHAADSGGPRTVRAVMPGIVVKVLVEPGAQVGEKDAILVVEAMKMQNEIRAGVAGKVSKLHVRAGQSVAAGAPLVEIAAAPSS